MTQALKSKESKERYVYSYTLSCIVQYVSRSLLYLAKEIVLQVSEMSGIRRSWSRSQLTVDSEQPAGNLKTTSQSYKT